MISVLRTSRGAAALLLLLAAAGCGPASDAGAAEGEAVVLTIAPENVAIVESREIRSGPAISGSLEPARLASLRAEIGGAVLAVQVEAGQTVQAGAVLVRLDDTAIREAVRSAESGVRVNREQADLARRNLARNERLASAGALPDQAVEQSRAALMGAEAALADAESRLTAARQQLAKTEIRAPFHGVVSERPVNLGDVVQPGTPLVTVVDPSSMRLEAAVPVSALGALKTGSPVEFTVAGYEGRLFSGAVSRINPTVDPATRQVRILATIPNRGGDLVGGLFAEGRVAVQTTTGLVVPFGALDLRGTLPGLTIIRGGQIVSLAAKVGLRDEALELAEILEGVSAGDTVLLGGSRGLAAGTAVRVGRDR